MKGNQRRFSFQNEGWYRKHVSKSHQINRVANWIANKQLDSRKKGFILDATLKLERVELMELLKELSKVATNERPGIDKRLIRFLITNLKFDFIDTQFIQIISKYLEYRYYPKDSVVVKEGQQYPFLYLLLEGRCEIISEETMRTVSGEAVFGEKELSTGRISKSTIKCKSECEFLVIKSSDYSASRKKVEINSSKNILGVMKKIPAFRCFSDSQLQELTKNAQIINLQEKGNILTQGKKHGYFYIIVDGEFTGTQSVNFKQKTVLKLERFDIINIEGIFNKDPVLNIKNTSQNNELYKFSILQLANILRSQKLFREMIATKLEHYKKISHPRNKPSPDKKIVFKSQSNIAAFISEIEDDELHSEPSGYKESYTQELRSRVNMFTKVRELSKSSDNRSGSIRSKASKIVQLGNIHQNLEVDCTKPPSFLLNAYKEKIECSTTVELDVQNRLYNNSTNFLKRLYHQEQEISRSMRMDKTLTSFKSSHQYNRSETLYRRPKTNEQNRRKDTEILLKRVQMSSCRKRRNRIKVMFDPKEIMNFNHAEDFKGASAEADYEHLFGL